MNKSIRSLSVFVELKNPLEANCLAVLGPAFNDGSNPVALVGLNADSLILENNGQAIEAKFGALRTYRKQLTPRERGIARYPSIKSASIPIGLFAISY